MTWCKFRISKPRANQGDLAIVIIPHSVNIKLWTDSSLLVVLTWILSGKSLVLEAIGRFLTQTGTSDGTVSETKQSKGNTPEARTITRQQWRRWPRSWTCNLNFLCLLKGKLRESWRKQTPKESNDIVMLFERLWRGSKAYKRRSSKRNWKVAFKLTSYLNGALELRHNKQQLTRKSRIYRKHSFKSIIKQVWKRRNAKKSWSREIDQTTTVRARTARTEAGIWEDGRSKEK